MKILFVVNNPYNALNPYVSTLIDGLKEMDQSISIDWGIDKFWSNKSSEFNIVHIMWPNGILRSNKKEYSTKELEKILIKLKTTGVKIVATCHNLAPHYDNQEDHIQAYKIVYENSDLILHLGEYSLELFQKEYPGTQNKLLYHHTYDKRYIYIPSHDKAKEYLGLQKNKKYILCFGEFRSNEERKMIIKLSQKLKNDNIKIIAPTFVRVPIRRNFIASLPSFVKYLYHKVICTNIEMRLCSIPDKDLTYYFTACDVGLIQRRKILNSGNLSMNFYFEKVVVGPNIGNIGRILKGTGNPTFDVNDPNTLYPAVIKGLILSQHGKGTENGKYAKREFSTDIISNRLHNYYNEIVNDSHKNFIKS